MRADTNNERRRLYLSRACSSSATTAGALTLRTVARALSCSPRQLQRAYAQFGDTTFQEDLAARRMAAAAGTARRAVAAGA